jgi:hypothetical protein
VFGPAKRASSYSSSPTAKPNKKIFLLPQTTCEIRILKSEFSFEIKYFLSGKIIIFEKIFLGGRQKIMIRVFLSLLFYYYLFYDDGQPLLRDWT